MPGGSAHANRSRGHKEIRGEGVTSKRDTWQDVTVSFYPWQVARQGKAFMFTRRG